MGEELHNKIDDEVNDFTAKHIDELFTSAVQQEASHIHLEPSLNEFRIRFRIQGQLVHQGVIPSDIQHIVSNWLKHKARMKISDTTHCQNGPFRHTTINNVLIGGRISTLPSLNGETFVIALSSGTPFVSLSQLGMEESQVEAVNQLISVPASMILVTGPWSSGKTQTLYVLAHVLNESGLSVVSLEDPIEIELPGITQTQINDRDGLSFGVGMRAILRQDPDIILLGEIGILEEAKIATDACLQGRHRVIAGLHTNSAVETCLWLMDAGLPASVIASSLSGIVVQRLVNKICPDCAESVSLCPNVLETAGLSIDPKGPWMQGKGCDNCNQTGYLDRIGIFEVVPLNEEFQEVLRKDPKPLLLTKALRNQAIDSLITSGIKKAERGITTIEEVIRVTS